MFYDIRCLKKHNEYLIIIQTSRDLKNQNNSFWTKMFYWFYVFKSFKDFTCWGDKTSLDQRNKKLRLIKNFSETLFNIKKNK